MSDIIKVALIFSATCIVCLAIWIFFSPYQGCVRSQSGKSPEQAADAGRGCALVVTRTQ
jgi:hypothetical protein